MVIRRTSFLSYDLFEMFKQRLLLSNRFDIFLWSFIHFMCVQVYTHFHLYHVDTANQLVRILYIFLHLVRGTSFNQECHQWLSWGHGENTVSTLAFSSPSTFLFSEVLEIVGKSSGFVVCMVVCKWIYDYFGYWPRLRLIWNCGWLDAHVVCVLLSWGICSFAHR